MTVTDSYVLHFSKLFFFNSCKLLLNFLQSKVLKVKAQNKLLKKSCRNARPSSKSSQTITGFRQKLLFVFPGHFQGVFQVFWWNFQGVFEKDSNNFRTKSDKSEIDLTYCHLGNYLRIDQELHVYIYMYLLLAYIFWD